MAEAEACEATITDPLAPRKTMGRWASLGRAAAAGAGEDTAAGASQFLVEIVVPPLTRLVPASRASKKEGLASPDCPEAGEESLHLWALERPTETQGDPREERFGVVGEAPGTGEGERIAVAARPGVGTSMRLVEGGAPGDERGDERSIGDSSFTV